MQLSQEEKQIGRENFYNAVGATRRDFLHASIVAVPAGAAYTAYSSQKYFNYGSLQGGPVRVGLIGSGDEGNILLTQSNPDYMQFIAYSDIRPSQIKRTRDGDPNSRHRVGFLRKYEVTQQQFEKEIQFESDYKKLLENPDIEVVVIALPLHLHYQAVMDALDAGKHVLCEKLMAHNVTQCKEMARKAEEKGLFLAIGHQRHYSVLYDNAVSIIENNLLGDIQHIRARWHRNNSWPRLDDGKNPIVDEDGAPVLYDSWSKAIPQIDREIDFDAHGYRSLKELVRWRLYDRTGGGLMAELGSHQLDACSIFLGKVRPIAVSGTGGKYFYEDDREVEDHVYVTLEFPGYDHPQGKKVGSNEKDVVVVTYSSINTNSLDGYGEQVIGTRGSMFVEKEQEVMLYAERAPGRRNQPRETEVTVAASGKGQPVLETAESPGSGPAAAGLAKATLSEEVSRGYREEMEHLAWCVRNLDSKDSRARQELRCRPEVALADAVYALTANIAIRQARRIEFKPEWFDTQDSAAPETDPELRVTQA